MKPANPKISFHSFAEFWPHYVCAHRKPLTRALHFSGTAAIIPLIVLSALYHAYLLLLIPVCGYGLAWIGHFLVERNRPAAFRHPLWSLAGDFKMFALMCAGKMGGEVKRCLELQERHHPPHQIL